MRNFLWTIIISSGLIALGFSFYDTRSWINSFLLSFSFLLIPIFLITCLLYLIRTYIYKSNKQHKLIYQFIILFFVVIGFLIAIHIPDYIRHQSEPGYIRYNSLIDYFKKELLESFGLALIYSIIVSLTNKILDRLAN